MEEKDFMKRVSEVNMPDVLEVKKSCMKELNRDGRDGYIHARFLKVAVIAMIMVCLCIMPVNSLAKNIVQQIKTMLNLNGKSVELGNIDKTNTADSISNTSTNSESGSNDLLYRTADGASITLEQGEEINISVMNGKEYDDVCISLVGKNVIQKIGSLNANMPYSYRAAVSGEYVIYAEKNQTNITNEVVIEYACNNGDDLYSLD